MTMVNQFLSCVGAVFVMLVPFFAVQPEGPLSLADSAPPPPHFQTATGEGLDGLVEQPDSIAVGKQAEAATVTPALKLFDATGGLTGPWPLVETDSGYLAEPLHYLYVTVGHASDLYAVRYGLNGAPTVAAANYWTMEQFDEVLGPIPQNARVTVNLEYWDGRDGWTLDQYACCLARFKAARPDISWSLYAAHEGRSPSEYIAIKQFASFVTDSVYPGVYADTGIRRVQALMVTRPDAIVLTGWVHQTHRGVPRPTPTEEEVRDIMRRLFEAGVTQLCIWMAPPKPGIVRQPEMILPMGRWAAEEFARVHRTRVVPVTDPVGPDDG